MGFLQRSVIFITQPQCRADFLFRCRAYNRWGRLHEHRSVGIDSAFDVWGRFRFEPVGGGTKNEADRLACQTCTVRRQQQRDHNARPQCRNPQWHVESVAMNQRSIDTPEQVLKFAPKGKPRDDRDATDQAGHALVAMLQQAANLSNDNCDRAMTLAHKLSMQLRAAEDRINQLQAEVEHFQSRAVRAEGWLQVVQKEIEEKLIAPMAATRLEQTSLH